MPARLILETDVIDVSRPPVLIYGTPGSGKTSFAQTASKPLTLDFDQGLHRSTFRKTGLRVDSWDEVIQAQKEGTFNEYETVVIDTVDSLLKSMAVSIIAGNSKAGTRAGGLSIQGWGVLKTTFDTWLSALRQTKQVILIAHQKEEKDGDNRMMRPDIAGGSYGIVMNQADIVGYISYRNNQRFVSWDPTDAYFAKNGASLESGPIPDFKTHPHFMADVLTKAKANLGHTSEASAKVAKAIEEWKDKLHPDLTLDQLNGEVTEAFKKIAKTDPTKAQVWKLILSYAEENGCVFDAKAKAFKVPEEAAA
jgi:shikimate kinase